jgi:hypothetical protein
MVTGFCALTFSHVFFLHFWFQNCWHLTYTQLSTVAYTNLKTRHLTCNSEQMLEIQEPIFSIEVEKVVLL